MPDPKSYENLSQQELLELLRAKDKQLADARDRLADTADKLAGAESKRARAETKLAEANTQIKALRSQNTHYQNILEILAVGMPTIVEMLTVAKENSSGDPFGEGIWERLSNEAQQLVKNASSAPLLDYLLSSGNESLKAKNVKDAEKVIKDTIVDVSKRINCLGKEIEAVNEGFEGLQAAALSQAQQQAYAHIQSIKAVDCGTTEPEQAKQPAKGRKKIVHSSEPRIYRAPNDFQSACEHNPNDYLRLGEAVQKMRTALDTVEKMENVHTAVNFFICRRCNTVVGVVDKDAPLPVGPERSISFDTVASVMYATYNGMPIDRCMRTRIHAEQLGHSTMYDQLAFALGHTLKPMLDCLKTSLFSQNTLIMDETRYPCLQMQGRGTKKPENRTDDDNGNPYVFACTTPHYYHEQAVLFSVLNSRAAQSIREVLPQEAAFNNIIVDGYQGYPALRRLIDEQEKAEKEAKTEAQSQTPDTAASASEDAAEARQKGTDTKKDDGELRIKQQSCLIHLRRYVVRALGEKSWTGLLDKLDQTQRRKLLNGIGKAMSPQAHLYFILNALRKLFVIEGGLKRGAQESLEDYFKRVQKMRDDKCRPLMDAITGLVDELAKDCACQKQKKWHKTKQTPYAEFVVYFKNQEKELRAFLENPQMVCHTNDVERQIRPITILRKNANFAQSKGGLQVLCDVLTLFETARLNGIDDPVAWLRDVHRAAFLHCAAGHVKKNMEKTGDIVVTAQRGWNWDELLKGFDCTSLLPWNYVKH